MTREIIAVVVVCLPLWWGVIRIRNSGREQLQRAEHRQKDKTYHHLVEFGNLLAGDIQAAKLAMNGKKDISKKRAEKIASATPGDVELWRSRLALIKVIDRLDRLGQAVELEIFDLDLAWQTNGEAILAFHERNRFVVDALSQAAAGIFPRYLSLIDELKEASALGQVERSDGYEVPAGLGIGT